MCGSASCATRSHNPLIESLFHGGRRLRRLRNAEERCKSKLRREALCRSCVVLQRSLRSLRLPGHQGPANFRYGGLSMTESQLAGFTPHTSAIMEYDASRAS